MTPRLGLLEEHDQETIQEAVFAAGALAALGGPGHEEAGAALAAVAERVTSERRQAARSVVESARLDRPRPRVDTRSGRYYARGMTEASPAEQPVEAEKKKRLFHRIPTSLLVTVIGIALTAWLLPAITRQWDDRQKAHDLQAGLVADIASATGHALVTANRADSLRPNHAIVGQQAATAWLLASIPLEARLRAYFPSEVVAAWNVYAYFVDRFVGVSKAQAYTTLGQPIRWMMGLPTSVGADRRRSARAASLSACHCS